MRYYPDLMTLLKLIPLLFAVTTFAQAEPYKTGTLLYQSNNKANKSGVWSEVTTQLILNNEGNCEKEVKKSGEDKSGNAYQDVASKKLKNKECAALYLAQELQKEFSNCRFNLPSNDEELVLDDNCLCYKQSAKVSGILSILTGRVSGSEKHRTAPWSSCLELFPENKRQKAQAIADSLLK